MIALEARGLAIGYRHHTVGEEIDLTLANGEVLCLLGPNGSGKTTLFRTLLGILPALRGEVRVAGRRIGEWHRRYLAHQLAYVPQSHAGLFAFTVEEVVLMGRTVRIDRFATPRPATGKSHTKPSTRSASVLWQSASIRKFRAASGNWR